MLKHTGQHWVLFGLILAIWLSTSACACGNALENLVGQARRQVGIERDARTSPTLYPTLTPTTRPEPTATLLVPTKPPAGEELMTIPSEPNTAFRIELTETQINEYVSEETYEFEGIEVHDIQVDIRSEMIIANLQVHHLETGMNLGLIVQGVPHVADGDLYFEVDQVDLDESVGGLTRIIARGLIEEAIKQYSTSQGIPVPVNDLEFETVTLESERIIATGRTR